MPLRSIILSFLFSIQLGLQGQGVGYLGKRIAFSINTEITPYPTLTSSEFYFNDKIEESTLLPYIGLDLEYVLTKRLSVVGQLGLDMMPYITYSFPSYSPYSYGNNTYENTIDTNLLSPNRFALNFGFKRYADFSPSGKYFSIGGGTNIITTTVYPESEYQRYNNGILIENTLTTYNTGTEITNILSFYAGAGNQIFLNDLIKIDYGIKLSYYHIKTREIPYAHDLENYDHRKNQDKIVDYFVSKSLFYSKMIQVYLNIGILK